MKNYFHTKQKYEFYPNIRGITRLFLTQISQKSHSDDCPMSSGVQTTKILNHHLSSPQQPWTPRDAHDCAFILPFFILVA